MQTLCQARLTLRNSPSPGGKCLPMDRVRHKCCGLVPWCTLSIGGGVYDIAVQLHVQGFEQVKGDSGGHLVPNLHPDGHSCVPSAQSIYICGHAILPQRLAGWSRPEVCGNIGENPGFLAEPPAKRLDRRQIAQQEFCHHRHYKSEWPATAVCDVERLVIAWADGPCMVDFTSYLRPWETDALFLTSVRKLSPGRAVDQLSSKPEARQQATKAVRNNRPSDEMNGSMVVWLETRKVAAYLLQKLTVISGLTAGLAAPYYLKGDSDPCFNCNLHGHYQATCTKLVKCGHCFVNHQSRESCDAAHSGIDRRCMVEPTNTLKRPEGWVE
ncbi:hypothetical protein M436DRAFT_64304 [Aureobasidium namibiae CBS 147.97]|uniref:Uncharacterized protein n=1 Tax=Aureobasidium namibiae CBS 147.97 TaxID=1043004 RepID=A0A074WJF4_9PEZI|nr:uncharacterized protein M436DRAFT_64304 [Aureobasidium namibiae CBS 147.97]KEQ73153.1 hypothetical protein M436DRAFT_64304 [Aureobasidium namibiae CBS 147.97]